MSSALSGLDRTIDGIGLTSNDNDVFDNDFQMP